MSKSFEEAGGYAEAGAATENEEVFDVQALPVVNVRRENLSSRLIWTGEPRAIINTGTTKATMIPGNPQNWGEPK